MKLGIFAAAVVVVAVVVFSALPAGAAEEQAGQLQQVKQLPPQPVQAVRDAEEMRAEVARQAKGPSEAQPKPEAVEEKPKPEPAPGVDFKPTNPPKFTLKTYPKTDGSTSAQPLGAIVTYKLLDVPYQWMIRPFQSDRWIAPKALVGENGRHRAITPSDEAAPLHELHGRLAHHGTHGSYVNVIEGKSDLAYICRLPSEDEIKLAKEKKVELEIKPVAMDAFVFIVNDKGPVKNLTLKQVRDIFSGKTTNWKDVGGPDAKINAYSRERNSGSQELMDRLVMKDLKMAELPGMETYSMMGPYSRLDRDDKGLGYTVYFYQKHMAMQATSGWGGLASAERPSVRMIAIDGVEPTTKTIASGKYPLTAEVYVVIRKDTPADAPARKLRDWLLTKDGQALVAATGYAPMAASRSDEVPSIKAEQPAKSK
jgi:phosphate transport system substrate-binding protein